MVKKHSALRKEYCLSHLLNSPGNFTASKLAWVKENEPDSVFQDKQVNVTGAIILH